MGDKDPVIVRVAGFLVVAENMQNAKMYEVVRVGRAGLLGEIIRLERGSAWIQVFEETSGLSLGEPVQMTGKLLLVELGPGLLENMYDSLQRPLRILEEKTGHFFASGISVKRLDQDKKWEFLPRAKKGDEVSEGDILGIVLETSVVEHRILVPVGIRSARVESIESGKFTISNTIAVLNVQGKKHEVCMQQFWPIRSLCPVRAKHVPARHAGASSQREEIFHTGSPDMDHFPLVKGGTGCVMGPFGSGKTVLLKNMAQHCDAQVVVFVACGARGNETAEFSQQLAASSPEGRTVLLVNTADMSVSSREISVYTGLTIAEYYRDMGYHVAFVVDSLSRWAEAMREISGRLREMPEEEGYPAYLGSRMAEFFERAGAISCLGSDNRKGSLTLIASVASSGENIFDPVKESVLHAIKTCWFLDWNLAHQRRFPAIDQAKSYSSGFARDFLKSGSMFSKEKSC